MVFPDEQASLLTAAGGCDLSMIPQRSGAPATFCSDRYSLERSRWPWHRPIHQAVSVHQINPSTISWTMIIAAHAIAIPTAAPEAGRKCAPRTTPRSTIQKLQKTMNTGWPSLTVKLTGVGFALVIFCLPKKVKAAALLPGSGRRIVKGPVPAGRDGKRAMYNPSQVSAGAAWGILTRRFKAGAAAGTIRPELLAG